jgi:uncharacterized repeat protein (TIGR02543 family)
MDGVRKNNKESGAVAIHRQIPAIKMMVLTAVIMIAITGLCFAGPSIADNDNENNENVILVYGFDKLAEALTPENNGKTVKLMGEEDTYVNYFYRLAPYGFPVIRLSVPADNIEWGMTIDLNGYHVNPATTETDDQFFVNSKFLSIEHGVSITIKDSSKDKSAILMNGRSEGAFEDFGGIIYNDGNLTIEGVTFRGGYSEDDGGGIYNDERGTLTIRNATFALCQAENNGGAIYNRGQAIIEGCSLSGNAAWEYGAAIYNEGTIEISKTFMTMNEAQLEGGAIYNAQKGKIFIRGGEISNNISGNGGAIWNTSDTVWTSTSGPHYALDIDGTEFRNNRATKETEVEGGSGYGGTIWNNGNISVKNAFISGSYADVNGGGLYNSRIMSVSGSTIYECRALNNGGGIYNTGNDAVIDVKDSTLSENVAKFGGGAFNELTGNDFTNTNNSFKLNACKIIDNTTIDLRGAGAGLNNRGVMVVNGCEIKGNRCDGAGGIYDAGGLSVFSTSFESNTVEAGNGAALSVAEGGTASVEAVVIKNNVTNRGSGGAISIATGSTLNLGTSLITDNSAPLYAGAIYVQTGGSLLVHDLVKVHGNTASIGKNIYLHDGTRIGFSGPVSSLSLIDFAMEDPYDPFTDHYELYSCHQGVFSYNEVHGFPIKEALRDNLPELFCDYGYWNSTIGMRLVSTWDELRSLAVDENIPDGTEVALANDIHADGSDRIIVERDLIIDLNGFTMDRGLTSKKDGGQVLQISGDSTVTIRDTIGTGIITGGYAGNGGAINIHDGSKLIIESGLFMNNRATEKGGAIYVNGELDMGGGTFFSNGCAGDGGAIYCDDDGGCTLNLNNVLFYYNYTDDGDGGALYLDYRNAGTIRNCRFIVCNGDDGGAIYMEADDQMLYIIDCSFYHNYANNGGAIYIKDGGIEISGDSSEFLENSASKNGGAVYTDERKVVVRDKVNIHGNVANKNGGAFYSEGIVDLGSGVDVSYNIATEHGGAICIKDGSTVNINSGVTLSYNEAGGNGGAIYNDDNGNINLWGGRIIYNSAQKGGGIYMDEDADDIDVSGHVVVMYNDAVEGNGIYLDDCKMNIVGELDDDTRISVTLDDQTGRFTNGYGKYNGDRNPDVFFTSAEGYLLSLNDKGEVCLGYDYSGTVGDESDFVDWASQINDYYNLSDKNWMSGISGERMLNEINIPGTHDSGMRKTESRLNGSIGDFAHMHYMAKTQYLYINEQLDAGVRLFDIRINNQHLVPDEIGSLWHIGMTLAWGALTHSTPTWYKLEDDGDNLWICHGKDKIGGTFYAMKSNGDDLSVDDVLDWFKTFLTIHPTETLIVGFDAEVQGDDNEEITNNRMYQKLQALSKEINPSTGKPYIYIESGKNFGESYTAYPYLKDCRGQIVLQGSTFGGITDNIDPVVNVYSQDVGFDCSINEKKQSIDRFLKQHVDSTRLKSDVTSHMDVLYKIGFNVGPTSTMYYIGKFFQSFIDKDIGPLYNADHILPDYLAESKPFDQRGQYVGWVKTDGAKAENFGYIWKSNFPDPKDSDPTKFTLNYVTVRAESGLGSYPIQSYDLLLGTTIVLPGCIYKDHGDLEFKGWMVGSELYKPGDKLQLLKDTTFVAAWDVDEFTISYVDYDDSEIDSHHYVPGTLATEIAAQAPTAYREPTAQYTYVFAGWEPAISDATENKTYKAKYDAILNTYAVTWMTWDGLSVIEIDENVGYGSSPYYNGPAQTRDETLQHTYTFKGWSEHVDSEDGVPIDHLPPVTGDVTYYASFQSTVKQCTIRFVNWDDTVLWEGKYAMETGPGVITPANDPVREPSQGKYYEFAGWDPTPGVVTEDAEYRATYNESDVLRYCITFMDWNAKILSKEWYVPGTSYSAVAKPADPTRESTTQFSYEFTGWDPTVPETGEVTESVTYRALYEYIVNKYTISFYDWDGTLLSSEKYDFGTSAESIVKPTPTREMDSQYTYTFAGWSPEVTSVDTEASYKATYTAELRKFTIIWKNYDDQVLETDQDVPYGSIPSYDGIAPTKPQDEKCRYEFSGWDPMASFVSGDVTYTASYNAVGLKFTITYELLGGVFLNGFPQQVTYTYGDEVRLYTDEMIAKEYYVFGAWHDNPQFTGEVYTKINSDQYGDWIFYMDWVPREYDIWVNDNDDGKLLERYNYTVLTETFTLPQESKEGYTLSYWEDGAGTKTSEVVIEKGSGGDRRYWVHWTPNTYDIEYYDGDTKLTGIEPDTYVYDTETFLGPMPAKEDYIRVGWYTTSDFKEGTKTVSVPAGTLGTFKVYAKYVDKGDVYWQTDPVASTNLIYNGEDQTLITGGNAVGGTAFYAVNSGEFSTDLPKSTDAGEYCVQFKIVKDDQDYDSGQIFVTIGKANSAVSIYPAAKEGMLFNNNEQELVDAGEAWGGTVRYSLDNVEFHSKIPKATNAGQYNVWYKSVGDSNHNDSQVGGPISVTISKAVPGEITPPTVPKLMYTGEAQELIYPIDIDWANVQYSLDGENYSTSIPTATDAGEYTVYYMVKDDVNYKDSESASVTVTINKLLRTWLVAPINKAAIYNEKNQTLIIKGLTTSGTPLYRIGDSGEYSSNLPTAKDVGDYTIWYKIEGDDKDNYILPEPRSLVASIKNQFPLTASIESWTYGEEAKKPIITGNISGGQTTVEYKRITSSDDEYSVDVPKDSGDYTMRVRVAASGGYASASTTANFSIHKASISPSVSIEGWAYGEEAKKPVVTGNLGDGTEVYWYKLSGASDETYSKKVNFDVGDYVLKATVSPTTNYQEGEATTNFTIVKGTITAITTDFAIEYDGKAHMPAKSDLIYNGTNYARPADDKVTIELKEGDDGISVGSHTVLVTVSGDSNFSDTSQAIEVTYNISKKRVSFVWTSPSDLTYSGTPKTPLLSITGLASSDVGRVFATIKLSDGMDNVNVGSFTYYVTGLTGDSASKYDLPLNVVSNEYTITKKPLSVSISESKTYDGSALVHKIVQSDLSGLVSGDSLLKGEISTVSGAAGTYDSPDEYTMTEALAVQNGIGNYDVSYTVNMVIAEEKYVLTYDSGMYTIKAGETVVASGSRVAKGTDITVTATEGYSVTSISLDGIIQSSTGGFIMPQKDTVLSVAVQGASHSITYSISGEGTVDQTILSATTGQDVVLSALIHPAGGYSLESLSYKIGGTGDAVQISPSGFKMPNGDITVYATFVQDSSGSYDITVSSMVNGTISLSTYRASNGNTVSLNIIPDDGYVLSTLKVMGGSEITPSESGGTWTFTMPAHDVTVSANCVRVFTVTVIEPEHGTLTPSAPGGISGTPVELTPAASAGYILDKVYVDDKAITADSHGKYGFVLQGDVQVTASFVRAYAVTIDSEITDGTVAVSEVGPFEPGSSVTLTITPGTDKGLSELWVAGTQVSPTASGTGYTYTFQIQCDTFVTAKFSPLYSVTVNDVTGGTISSSLSGKAPAGTSVTLTVTKSSGYKLDHLIVNGEIITVSGYTYVFTLLGDTTVSAEYSPGEYTITFNANGGSCSTSTMTTDRYGKLPSLPSASRSGYNFSGWYTSASGGTKVTTSYEFDQDTTVYAHWTAKPVTYRITFDGNGGTPDRTYMTTKTNGRLASLPADPVWEGHRFDGWYKSRVSSVKVTTSTVFYYSMTVFAHWTEYSLNVTYNANGGSGYISYQNIMYSDASKALKANTFVRDGYVFAGWNTAIDGSGTSYSDGQDVSKLITAPYQDLSLYAQWTAIRTVTFAVSEEGYGTVSKQSVTVLDGTPVSASSDTVTVGMKSITATSAEDTEEYSYGFVGWTGIPLDGKVTSDITIIAEFERTVNTYTVTVDVSDDECGTVDMTSITAGYGTGVTVSENVLIVGEERITATPAEDTEEYSYGFVGWTGIPEDGRITSDITVTADFSKEDKRLTVTFVVSKGASRDVKVIPGNTVSPIPGPKLIGVEFKGWFLEDSNVSFDFTTPITEDIALYAHYGPKAPSTEQSTKISAVMSPDLTAVVTAYDGKVIGKGTILVSVYQLMTIHGMDAYVFIGSFEQSFDCSMSYLLSDISEKTYGIASGPGTYGVMAEVHLDNGTERLTNYTKFSVKGGV